MALSMHGVFMPAIRFLTALWLMCVAGLVHASRWFC
jgi:hypothetical protein